MHNNNEIEATYQEFFSFLLQNNIRKGWSSIGSIKLEEDYFHSIVFHTHPEDGDKVELLLKPLLNDFWVLERFASNRFLLCSKKYYQIKNIENKSIEYIEENFPNLGYETAESLRKLINKGVAQKTEKIVR